MLPQTPLVALVVLCGASMAASLQVTERLRETAITLDVKPHSSPLGVPMVDPPVRVSGYFKLNRTFDAHMFYFYYAARVNPDRSPLVLWMTGGPGCSSELAVLYEQGPYMFNPNHTKSSSAEPWLVERQYGWDVYQNMIFVDQPIGTGFSYSEDDRDRVYGEAKVGEDMLDFLQEFYKAHPEMAPLPLYITGESYAGHYVPAVSHRVWLSNTNKEGPYINLQGIAIGNGLTEPTIQFGAYGDFAVDNGLISPMSRTVMNFLQPLCSLANTWCESTNWDFVCYLGLTYCMATQFQPILAANPNINVYDITKDCEGRLCYDFTQADEFLNLPSTRKALGVGDREWMGCNPDVYQDMAGDWLHRFDKVLPEMMADGIKVMIYAGDLDLICNWLGNRRWVDSLDWSGAEQWAAAADVEWKVAGVPAGMVKEAGPLSFVRVYKAGHMVPMDQPLHGLAMITSFTRGKSLASLASPADTEASTTPTTTTASLNEVSHGLGGSHMGGKGPSCSAIRKWFAALLAPQSDAEVAFAHVAASKQAGAGASDARVEREERAYHHGQGHQTIRSSMGREMVKRQYTMGAVQNGLSKIARGLVKKVKSVVEMPLMGKRMLQRFRK